MIQRLDDRGPDGRPPRVAIVVPAYNAGRTIEGVFERIPADVLPLVVRHVIVNDGSTDDTAEAIQRIASRFDNVWAIDHGVNRGYGATEKTLLSAALETDAEVIALLHSDGQYRPEELPRLIAPFSSLDGADIVQGSRMMDGAAARRGGMPLYKYFANRCLTAVENLAFGMKMAEFHSGFMLYSRRALEEIPFLELEDNFCFDQTMLILAKIRGLKIVQVPIPTHYGDEVSHLRPIHYGFATLSLIWAYKRGRYHALLAPEGSRRRSTSRVR